MFSNKADFKNFFSLLVGYLHNCKPTDAYQQYIISVYDSFKGIDEKDYAAAWYRFFDVCTINEINKNYFLIYKKYFSDSEISYLLEKRCSINIEHEISYKTIRQLLKAVNSIGISHLKENHAILWELFKKKGVKEKFWTEVSKEYGLQGNIVKDYPYFMNFCNEFGFDNIEVLKNLPWYKCGYFFTYPTLLSDYAELFYDDVFQIEKTDDIKKEMFYDNPSKNPCHLILSRFGMNHNDRIDLLYKYFEKEIIDYMSYRMKRNSIMYFNPLIASHWKARYTEYVGTVRDNEKVDADIDTFIESIK